ncbi:MAG: HAMP domain-containing histidine kinase [Deltaproteobacteria bacterium]|nr:HAMP domain-containing histidine kinase [Deltaproteobacteria bacterium]
MAGTSAGIRIRRIQENLFLGRPILILALGVLTPVFLSTTLGIVALFMGENSKDLILGAVGVFLAISAIGSGVVVAVLLGRRARTARLQSDLLGNVSHELKTPLAAIRMYGQTLQMGTVDGNPDLIKQCVDSIVRETEWLGTMIERLLVWRTAAKDRDNLNLVSQPLDKLARDVATRFSRMLPPGEVKFDVTIDTNLPVLHDQGGIGSILINLLTNAYKYTNENKEISLSVKDGEGQVKIIVQDNGIGIPKKDQKAIFEPFYRVTPSFKGWAGGAGLGLAIVDFMVSAHSGTISVDSEPGKGTVFTITLPASPGEGDAK